MESTKTPEGCTQSRGPARYQAILDATLDVLSETGFENLTIDAVASRARASKATIYRNWDGKAPLVADAITRWHGMRFHAPDTGSLRGDLLALCRLLHAKINSRQGSMFVGLLRTIQEDPQLAERLRAQTHCHATAAYSAIIERAVSRGEISACPDPQLVLTIAPALMFFRKLFTGDPVDEQLLERIVDEILLPALTRSTR